MNRKPFAKYSITPKVEINIFGKPENWKSSDNLIKISLILKGQRIKNLYVPSSSDFSGKMCDPSLFKNEVQINGIDIFNDCKTEGTIIPVNSGLLIPTADCHVIVYYDIDNDILIAVHAGLGSVIDKQRIIEGEPSRENESIVDDIIRHIKPTNNYQVMVVGGITYKSFRYDVDDELHGKSNQKIFDYLGENYSQNVVPMGHKHGGISIPDIIKEQFVKHGFDSKRIKFDGVNTFEEEKKLWSHHRFVKTGKDPISGRNGILVIHK